MVSGVLGCTVFVVLLAARLLHRPDGLDSPEQLQRWLDHHWSMLKFWFARNRVNYRIHHFANPRIGRKLVVPMNRCKNLATAYTLIKCYTQYATAPF